MPAKKAKVSDKAKAKVHKAANTADGLIDKAEDLAHKAANSKHVKKAETATKETVGWIKKNPLKSVAAAATVGYILGLFKKK